MSAGKIVLKSVNNADGGLCVDVFRRSDGSFGFEEYRRDVEDPSGWFAVGGHEALGFETEEDALSHALRLVPWFKGD